MPDYLLDTGPLVRHLRNRKDATQLLSDLTRTGSLYISVVSRMEIVQGMREDQRRITYELFDSLQSLPIDEAIADLAGTYLGQYRRQGITLQIPDTLIAATAIVRSLMLVTYDRRGFPMPELRLANLS
jgi:predicted nucleic acid-binding protein